MNRGAFTLPEMMVSIFIVALLSSLSLAAFQRVNSSFKTAECASNLREIGLAFSMYANEHDGNFPPSTSIAGSATQRDLWAYALWPYFYPVSAFEYPDNDFQGGIGADKNVFHCPATRAYARATSYKEIAVPGSSYGPGARMSYAMSDTLSTTKAGASGIPFKALLIKNPSGTALVAECYGNTSGAWGYHFKFGLIPHNKGGNFLYCDGHVSWLRYEEVPKYSNSLEPFWTGN